MPDRNEAYESYCLHCHTPAEESAGSCVRCRASFTGSGRFDKVHGPRPSSVFFALFDPTVTDRAA
jgi:hypothetical protein